MPRRPRMFVEGAVYHVYNRFARGAEVFAKRKPAARFLDLLARARERDGLTVLAWCLMPTHFHLAVRVGAVPLARTMGFVQGRFGQDLNRRAGTAGPLWQGRYRARMVLDERYLMQLVAYVHLNPVAAGCVSDPARYELSGHAGLLGRTEEPLIDVDATLALFGGTRAEARREYLQVLKADRKATWIGETPGTLPWWRRQRGESPLTAPAAPALDPLGRPAAPERPRLDAATFVLRACAVLDAEPVSLRSEGKNRSVSAVRYLVAGLAIERWGIRAGLLGAAIGRRAETVGRWALRAGKLRAADGEFRQRYEMLDARLAAAGTARRNR